MFVDPNEERAIKRDCLGCSFLCFYNKENRDECYVFTKQQREKPEGTRLNTRHLGMKCYKGIWYEDFTGHDEKPVLNIIKEDRSSSCFFYPFIEGLHMEGADELRKQNYENNQLMDEIKRTNKGLRIAGIGLAITAITSLVSLGLQAIDHINEQPIEVELIQPER